MAYNLFPVWLKKFLLDLGPSDLCSSAMSVSAEEVAKHNKDSDCWVIVGDQVLDVTNFLSAWAENWE